MVLKRVIVVCSITMLMGGCSHLLRGPEQYASLSPVRRTDRAGGTDRIADVVIPGTLTTRSLSQHGGGIDPLAVLQRRVSAKADQESLRVDKLTERPLAANPSQKAARLPNAPEPTSTASLHTLNGDSARYPTENYDREATMDRLVKGGQEAAKPICTGC
jgi:hypothetical protein